MLWYVRVVFGFGIAALIVGVPWGYATYRQAQMRNFHIVRDGKVYRSGQMSLTGLQQTVHDYGFKTVVTLRDSADPKEPPPDALEEYFCKAEGILYVRIPPRSWWSPDGHPPIEKGVKRFLQIMDDPANYPVLIHCFAGIHRSGAFCAIYRMEFQKWSNCQALRELRSCGYSHLDEEWDLLNYLEDYVPRWKRQEGAAAPAAEARTPPTFWLAKRAKPHKKKMPD
jgi:protein tyrosine/serine phosphatase